MLWISIIAVVAVAGAVGAGAWQRKVAAEKKAEEERAKVEAEKSLTSLFDTLRQMERVRGGVMELHPLDKLARGAQLGEQRGLLKVDFQKGKIFVSLTRAGREATSTAAPEKPQITILQP